jgi:hypothetical protein
MQIQQKCQESLLETMELPAQNGFVESLATHHIGDFRPKREDNALNHTKSARCISKEPEAARFLVQMVMRSSEILEV